MAGSLHLTSSCAECGADLSDAPDRKGIQLEGMVIERKVRLASFIGEGAMGWVYRGQHLALDSSVAVKLMKPTGDPETGAVNDERFAREARAASRLNNPHIISIMDFGRTPGGLLYIVSELLGGLTLTELIEDHGPLPLGRCLRIADQILSGLEEAHDVGLVHRDLKPDNIMITPLRSGEDFVKILDFGIAKLSDQKGGAKLTRQGQVVGTPTYMSPEQIRGQDVGPTSDLYALGGMLFEMIAGRPPFDSEALMEVLGMHLSSEPPKLRDIAPENDIPEALEEVISRSLRKKARDRFPDASAMRKALASIALDLARRGRSCPTCGEVIADTAKFCASCGTSIASSGELRGVNVDRRATADTVLRPGLRAPSGRDEARPAVSTGDHGLPLPANTLDRRLRVEQTFQLVLSGRELESETIRAFLSGKAGALEILGTVGSGRTRLLQHASETAHELALVPLWVEPDPTLARRPWHPVREAVASVLGLGARPTREDVEAALLGEGLAAEDRLGILELFELRDPECYLEHAVRLRETRAAALRCLGLRSSATEPLLLLVDDADELDGASLALFAELAGRADDFQVKVILVAEQQVLPSSRRTIRITPRPLVPETIAALMQTIDPQESSTWSGRLRLIAERTGGIPLHVVQCLRLLAEGGTEVDAPLGDVVITRVQRLPTEARRLLQTVSVMGRRASVDQIAALLGHAPSRFAGALQLLVKRDLVQVLEPGEAGARQVPSDGQLPGASNRATGRSLRITHPRIADLVREAIPADARRALHQVVLEELRAAGESPIMLARHAAEAHLGENALQLLKAAGAQAELMLDDAGAAIHYRRALQEARWEVLLEGRHETCLDLAVRLGNSLRYSGDNVGALMVLKEAVLDAEGKPAFQARALHAIAMVLLDRGEVAQALCRIQEAVSKAFFAGEPELLSQIYLDMGRVLDAAGDEQRALQELAEGVLMVTAGDGPEAAQTPDSFWRLLALLSDLHFRQDDLLAALETAQAALQQAERHQSRIGTARCHFLLGRLYDRAGDPAQAEAHHAKALAAFRQLGDRRSAAEVLLADASGRPDNGEQLRSQAQRLLSQVQWNPHAPSLSG